MWRDLDYFLWVYGFWRAREDFGFRAIKAAQRTGDVRLAAHATYDSVAETRWHRDGPSTETEALLDQADQMLVNIGDSASRSKVLYYKSRYYRKADKLDLARSAANEAIDLSRSTGAIHTLGLSLNALGSVLRASGEHAAAIRKYDEALEPLAAEHDEELVAVISRNKARVFNSLDQFGDALAALEYALAKFQELGLKFEMAEALIDHAYALAGVNELEEAEAELQTAAGVLSEVGASIRDNDIATVRAFIQRRTASQPPGGKGKPLSTSK